MWYNDEYHHEKVMRQNEGRFKKISLTKERNGYSHPVFWKPDGLVLTLSIGFYLYAQVNKVLCQRNIFHTRISSTSKQINFHFVTVAIQTIKNSWHSLKQIGSILKQMEQMMDKLPVYNITNVDKSGRTLINFVNWSQLWLSYYFD